MKYYDYHASVRYADLAEDNKLSAVAALGLMQEAATHASAAAEKDGGPSIRSRFAWILCGWKLRIFRRPVWNEELTVRTWPRTISLRTSDRDFRIMDKDGAVLIAATSRWLLLDTETGHAGKVTPELAACYDLWEERALSDELPGANTAAPADAPCTFTYRVMLRDIDTLHHVNNLRYLELAREGLPEEIAQQHFENIEILYKRQFKLRETIYFHYSCAGGRHLVELRGEDGKSHTLIWFY